MNKNTLLDALAWFFLLITVIFVFWYILGDSPTEWYLFLPIVFTVLFKIVSTSNDVAYLKGDYHSFKENTRESFQKVKEDTGEMKRDIQDIKKLLARRYHGG